MKKEQIFNNLIFESFKDSANYDLIKHGMNRARNLMLQHKVFENAPTISQYDMCMTIYIIATQSSTKAISEFRILSAPEKRTFDYAINEGYVAVKSINSGEIKLLE